MDLYEIWPNILLIYSHGSNFLSNHNSEGFGPIILYTKPGRNWMENVEVVLIKLIWGDTTICLYWTDPKTRILPDLQTEHNSDEKKWFMLIN